MIDLGIHIVLMTMTFPLLTKKNSCLYDEFQIRRGLLMSRPNMTYIPKCHRKSLNAFW